MPKPTAYHLPAVAPFDEWSTITHAGGDLCFAAGAICINLPAVAFRDDDHTLNNVLKQSCGATRAPADLHALAPLKRLALLLLHPHSKAPRKRAREALECKRRDVRCTTFSTTHVGRECERHRIVKQRCVFVIEELRHRQHPHSAVGVRLWKVFIDPAWRESRALGLLMLDGVGGAPRSPVELLHLYNSVGRDGMKPIVSNADAWLALHSEHGDWATRTLLDADDQRIPGGLRQPLIVKGEVVSDGERQERPSRIHPLSPELLLSPSRKQALLAGLQAEDQVDPDQLDPRNYERPAAGQRAFDASVRAPRTAAVLAPRPLRFPAAASLYGLQPHADPLETALPMDLLARLRRAAP